MAGLKEKFLQDGSIHSRQSGGGSNGAFFTDIKFQDAAASALHLKMSNPLPYYGGGGLTDAQADL